MAYFRKSLITETFTPEIVAKLQNEDLTSFIEQAKKEHQVEKKKS